MVLADDNGTFPNLLSNSITFSNIKHIIYDHYPEALVQTVPPSRWEKSLFADWLRKFSHVKLKQDLLLDIYSVGIENGVCNIADVWQ